MSTRIRRVAGALATAGALALSLVPAAHSAEGGYVVVYDDGVGVEPKTDSLEASQAFRASQRYRTALKGFAAHLTDAQRRRVLADPDVAYVRRDAPIRATALAPVASTETVPPGVRRIRAATTTQAHAASTTGVAVIDTGLDLANADLNAVSGVNCVKPGAPAQDDNGHGTHVGGIVAGRNDGSGVIGAAPGTRLHAVKVLDRESSGTLSQVLCGIEWVARNAVALSIRVVNTSIGGGGSSDGDCGRTNNDPLHAAICSVVAMGINVVASAGNANVDLARTIPAAYSEVLTVTAMTDTDGIPGGRGPAACSRGEVDDTAWTQSNYAVSVQDAAHVVAAPGACILSTKRRGGTTTMSGTSMAAPHVAGMVASCLDSGGVPGPCASLTPAQVIRRIRADARAAQVEWGFTGDLLHPVSGEMLGALVSSAGY
jgi:subtilisin